MTHRVKWWGWGDPSRNLDLKPGFRDFLFDRLDIRGRESLPERPLPELAPPNPDVARSLNASADDMDRLLHAAGKSYVDLVRIRRPKIDPAPDAVAWPETPDDLRRIFDVSRNEKWAVVPFGGGTSVLRGVEPLAGEKNGVVTVDLTRMNRVLSLDKTSRTAHVESGIFGPALEMALSREGFELGHYPQSFEYSTLGGWIAARSAGQNSSGYGRIEDLVVSLRAITPAGEIVTREVPSSATGPELREVLIGSEGSLGIITDAVIRIHPRPDRMHYESYLFQSFAGGIEALRGLAQDGPVPVVARLSDEAETELSLKQAGADSKWGFKLLRLLGKGDYLSRGAHLLLGYPTPKPKKRFDDALGIGRSPGEHWEKSRFDLPYFRDTLMDYGILVETLETATGWSNILKLYESVRNAIQSAIPGAIVLTHVSHLYPDGASLYFTFIADAQGKEIETWKLGKDAASRAILENGGTISHHHGVGMDHRKWLAEERGPLQVEMLRSLKSTLDPDGILNPGKLVP